MPFSALESFFYVLIDVCIYYDNNGKLRKPSPTVTMFAEPPPKDIDPFKTSFLAKFYFTTAPPFDTEVIPTLGIAREPARAALVHTLQRWRAAAFDGAAVELARNENNVQRMYNAVLEIIDQGMEDLKGR
jgi:hypothetical protein